MNPTNLTYFLIFYVPLYLATHIGLYLLFKKANVKMAWLAFFPIVCYWPWIQLTGRPKTWMLWALLPAADIIIWFSLVIDMMESFGKLKFIEQVIAVLFPFYYYPKLAMAKDVVYLGQARDAAFRKKYIPAKRGASREWADAIFFAFIVAYLIRTFQLEPYKIPTSSMEDSMMVGDFLFVSKMNYGPRFPITPIAFPLVHQDLAGAKAYSDILHLPYMRLPGFQTIKRNDPVVFNVPWDQIDPTERPVDKMQNYVKRCVGIPGDKLQIKDGILYINDEIAFQAPKIQHNYIIKFKPNAVVPTEEVLTNEYDIYDFGYFDNRTIRVALNKDDLERFKTDFEIENIMQNIAPKTGSFYSPDGGGEFNALIRVKDSMKLSDDDMRKLGVMYALPLGSDLRNLQVMMDENNINPAKYKQVFKVDTIKHMKQLKSGGANAFPDYMEEFPWNKDNYGPIILPRRGEAIAITKDNFYLYQRAISIYEGNADLELRGSTPYMDGKPLTTYTFQFDYYWMMGDNRDNSLDSRFWGYVPENHIVGKPLFVFFSIQYKHAQNPVPGTDGNEFVKVRWNRMFKGIQ
jgi:signal peptidase I